MLSKNIFKLFWKKAKKMSVKFLFIVQTLIRKTTFKNYTWATEKSCVEKDWRVKKLIEKLWDKRYRFVCWKQEKMEKKRKKNGAPPAIELMWPGSSEPRAAWCSLDFPAKVRRPELAGVPHYCCVEVNSRLLAAAASVSPQRPKHAELHRSLAGDDTPPRSHELHYPGLRPPCCFGSTRRKQ